MARKLDCKNEKKEPRDWRKVLIACGILAFLIAVGAFFVIGGPKLFGFVVAGEQKAYSDSINEKFNETYEYNWTLQNVPAGEFQLNSVKLTGSAAGNAKVYIITDSGRLLIFDSSNIQTGTSPLTAFAAAQENTPMETAQPGPPSSGELSSPEVSQPNQADTTSGPGAESPAPAPEGEQLPPTEQPPVEAPANETPPIEIPPENVTVPKNITNETNQTQEIPLVNEIPFENACVDTCYISEILNRSSYILQIELDPNAVLQLDSIYYQLTIENATNATNETAFFATDIVDSSNNTVAATIEFVDPSTNQVEAIGQSEQGTKKTETPAPMFQAAAVAEEQPGATGLDIPKGKYKIKVKPQNMPITEITFDDIDVTQNITDFIKLDNVPVNTTNLSGAVEVYAIDPTAFTFTTATVTAVAAGNSLYKCKNWDFANQNCTDNNWTFVQAITPGETYSFTLTPEDPAYAQLMAQSCVAENSAAKGSFGSACTGTYPAACGSGTGNDRLSCNDGYYESHTFTNGYYGGVKITEYNSSVTNCQTITNVNLCYEWWVSSTNNLANCDISVDNSGGSSWQNVTTTCPGGTTNPGVTCTNVTSKESWNCSDFFGTSGTRAMAKSELERNSGGSTYTGYWDVLYFQVNYTLSSAPTVTLVSPTPSNNTNTTANYVFVNVTAVSTEANIDTCLLNIDSTNTTMTKVGSGTSISCNLNKTGLADGTHTYKVYANNTLGVMGVSAAQVITTDTTPPTIAIALPANTTYATKTNLPLNYTATENVAVSSCWYSLDGGANTTLTGCANTTFNVASDGGYNVRVYANNTAGGIGSDIHYFTIDTTPPATVTGLGETLTNRTWIYWNWTNPTDVDFSQAIVYIDGSNVVNISNAYYNATGFNCSTTHNITINTKDTIGNINTTNVTDSVVTSACLDITPPTTTLVSPANGNVTTSNNVTFACNATDAVQLKNITFYWNYTGTWQPNGTTTVTGASNSTTVSRTNLNNGNYLWNCYACDNSSNCAFAPANYTVTVNYTAPDITPPASVTGLSAPLYSTTWIYWNWTNPADSDFNHTEIWIDGNFVTNVSTPSNSYNATGFTAVTSHTIGTRTADHTGNINTTFVNNTAQTLAVSASQNNSVNNAAGTPVNVTLTIINSTGQTVYSQTGTIHNFNLFGGNYTIIIQPVSSASVSVITYYNYVVDGSFALPGFDEPAPAAGSLQEFAANPLGQFQSAIMTVNPTGDIITKCDNYTFVSQSCEEDYWATNAYSYTLGAPYNITFAPGDPGFAVFNFTPPGGFEVQSTTNTFTGTSVTNDSYIRSAAGFTNSNYGSATDIRVGNGGGAGAHRGIIKFNLSSIPSGVRIDNANLSLYANSVDGGGAARTHGVHKIQQSPARNWVELQVTWVNYATGSAWTTGGGDYNATASATTSVSGVGFYYWNVTADVQNFTGNQSANFGWIIKDATESGTNRKYYNSSNSAGNRPTLTVNWTDIQAPRWSNQSQNASVINNTGAILLSAYWTDNVNLSSAVLSTNESGTWQNKTGVYGSPKQIGPSTGNWSNFTWSNSSASGIIGWQIWANDTQGNWNSTNIMTFNVTVPNTAPNSTIPTIDPAVAYKTSTLYCNATLTDTQQTSLTAYWTWYKNSVVNLTGNKTGIANGTNTNITMLTSGNLTKGNTWICQVIPNDGTLNGTAVNSTGKTIQNSIPTTPTSLTPASGTYGGTNNTIPINCSGSTDADSDTISYAIDAFYNSAWTTINASGTGIYNWNISALSTQTNVALRCNATDGTNTTTYYTPAVNITIDNTKPATVILNNPANNSLDGDGSVLFNCSATDNIALANISLYLNSALNQTNSVTGTSNTTTFSKTLANGNYTWYCLAIDSVGNTNTSATYSLQVNTAAVPVSSNFTGNTTNWASLPDLSNICNGTAILEIPSYGQIQWYGCVNAASQNFNTNVNISNNFISVNFGLNPTFNSSAHLTIRNLTWDSDPEILMNGVPCDNVTVCQNATYNNVTGTLTFDTTHFTNFTTIGNARLVIWDQNDTGMPGGNLPACLGSQIKFFANYTRSVNGNPITGATCIANFTDSSGNSMTYNATTTFYDYNRTFSTLGVKSYNISCVKTTPPTRQYIALSDSVNITDCAAPQWSNNQSSYPAKYNASQSPNFNITWTDNVNVSTVRIEGNWSGSPQNYSANLISGNTTNGIWNYSTGPLAAGTYYWKSYANDTSGNWNSTSNFVFTIGKADNPTDLYLNGNKNQNVTITYPAQSNATGTALIGAASLFRDSSPVSNPEVANLTAKPAGYNYTVTTPGNTNYSANSTTYYLFVNKQSTAVDIYISGNLNQNVTITYGTPSNVTAIGTNGTVTLLENGSNLGNPRIATLGASYYNYTASIPDDANHTGSSRTYFLNVTPAASQVQLLLDGSPANKTVEVGSTVNLTATLITPSTGVVQLYRAGSQIQSGSAPITNLSTFSTLGTFNITEIYPATTNYTTSSDIHYVITQDTTPPIVYSTSPGNNTAIASHTQGFTFNATDNYYTTLNCTLYINNIASGNNPSVAVNTPTTITNTTIPEGNNQWYVNCTDGSVNTGKSETRILTVDLTAPIITHVRPVQNDIVGYNVTLDIDITDNLVGVASAWYEIRNSSGIIKSGTLPGPAYQDVWNSKTVQDGNYTFRAYANDTLGNQGNSSVNFTVDNTAPFIQILRPLNDSKWNANFNLNVTIQNTRINASTYNITNSTGYVVQSNSNNSINSPTFAWTDLVNVNSLPSGVYVISVYALDSIGYTTVENSTFIIDKLAPQYSSLTANPSSPAIYSPTQTYEFNATWTDNFAVNTVIFEFNGTNYTITPSGNVYSKTFVGLPVGAYNYKWYANDSTGNTNSTGTSTYTINKAPTTTSLYLNGAQANTTITYTATSNATAVTSVGSVTLYRNGTSVGTSEIATLAAGYYNYTAINTGDSNYLPSSETWFLTVNKQPTAVDLYLNGTQNNLTVIYPTQTNVTTIGYNGTATLYKNGSIISSPEIATLAAGTYNYTAAIAGDANHTGSSKIFFLTVDKTTPTLNLLLDGSPADKSVMYPTQTNATAFESNTGDSDVSYTLYRDNNTIGSGSSVSDVQTLGTNTYVYKYNTTGGTNYTSNTLNRTLTVGIRPTAVDLYLNGAQNNLTITYGTQTNVTAIGTNGTVTLYRNGTNVGTQEIATLAVGYYNYTASIPDDVNHTGSSKTFFLTVNVAQTYVNLSLNGAENNITLTYPQTLTAVFSTNILSANMYRNGSNINAENNTAVTLGVGYYNYTVINPGNANYTGSSKTFFVTVNKQPTAVDLFLNGVQSDLNITYGTTSNATAIGYNASVTLYRDGTPVSNPEIAALPYGLYNYTAVINDTANKTGSSKTFFLTVGKQGTEAQLYLNGNRSNLTITYGTQSNATAVFINKTGILYRNGVNITNPNIAILAAGTYNYSAVIDPDANKTGSTENWTLTVNKAAGNITLLLNGTNNDFNANRSQTINITGIRNAGEVNLQLYDSGALINSGAPIVTNITSYSALGPRNITLILPETQNYTSATSTHFLSVFGILYAYVTAPTGTPKYYEGQNITFRGYVYDELANPITGANAKFEPINGSFVYACYDVGEGGGFYNCTLDTTGMASPKTYNVRINATKAYYHAGVYTNNSIFFLESGQKANLILYKIPSVQSINSSHITYNITLQLANGRGTSENTILTDPDAGQTWNESTIFGAQRVNESYLLTYARGSVDSTITLQKANATGYDPFYNTSLFAESNQPVIAIPQNITGAQLTLIKNLIFVNQTTTNITYTIVDTIVNSGGSDLSGISIVDSDISLTTTANLTRGASTSYSGNKTIAKNSQSYTFNFTQTSAFADSTFFYSNAPSIIIPGYGGPYDVIIDSLPSSVTAGSTITGVVKAINMNSEISEDRTLTTWIQDSFGNITALDVRTIFVGRNQSAMASITLTVPSTPGTYYFVSKLTWPTADANASKAFDVTSVVVPPVTPPAAPGGGVIPPTNVTVVLPPGVPQDIIDSLIALRNTYNELKLKNDDLNNILKAAEDAAARGNYDLARNLLQSAYGYVEEIQLELCGKTVTKAGITLPALPSINIAQFFNAKWLWWILITTITVIFIIALIIRRGEEMALEAELLAEERKHLEKVYDKVSSYLNRKITRGDKDNGT